MIKAMTSLGFTNESVTQKHTKTSTFMQSGKLGVAINRSPTFLIREENSSSKIHRYFASNAIHWVKL